MAGQADAEALAQALFEARGALSRAGRTLHDEIGPLLSASGLRLQLLGMNRPETAEAVAETLQMLDDAMERVRALSQKLNPAPAARLGLQRALRLLIEESAQEFPRTIGLTYATAVAPPPEVASVIYDALAAALQFALRDPRATRIRITVKGARRLSARVVSNGTRAWPAKAREAQTRLFKAAGVLLDRTTKESTIVSIQYADGRPPRG